MITKVLTSYDSFSVDCMRGPRMTAIYRVCGADSYKHALTAPGLPKKGEQYKDTELVVTQVIPHDLPNFPTLDGELEYRFEVVYE